MPLRIARKIARLSQGQVARAAEVDVTFISLLERQERDLSQTGYDTVRRIAAAFNLTADELMWLAKHNEPEPAEIPVAAGDR